MDIKKLQVFLTVAKYNNFTKAGEDLGYTQSGITQMMKSLENEVGFPLFIKNHHGVTLTMNAKALIPSIRALLAANETLNQEIAFRKGAKKGAIIIGSFASCAVHWLPKIISNFQKKYPEITIEIIEGSESELSDWVSANKVDIGFTSYQKHQPYTFIPVYDDPMYAVMPKGHAFAEHKEIPIEWFENEPFIVSEYSYANEVYQLLKKHKVKPDIKYTMTNDFSIVSMVEHGLGLSILPGLMLRGRTENLEIRPLKPWSYRKLGLAILSKEELTPAAKIFIKYAQDYLLD